MKLIALMSLPLVLAIGEQALAEIDTATLNSELKITTDISSDLKMTTEDRTLSKQWQLTETDWLKYKMIMKGPRGTWSPGLDPLTALGVSETDISERKRYAEIWMRVETRRAELEIAFEIERQIAAKKLHGNQQLIKNKQWIEKWEEDQIEIHKTVFLFADAKCLEKCKKLTGEVIGSISTHTQLEVYFNDSTTSEEIGVWAAFMKIPPETVRSKKITLNFDDGKASSMKVDLNNLPQVRVVDIKTGDVTTTFK
jgi:integrating conjugative element protein (TIGR03759 family)